MNIQCKKILVLEDDELFGELLQDMLEAEGHTVSLHTNASSAITYAKSNAVDLVISDMLIEKNGRYSGDGGIKLISMFKQVWDHPAPIIAISGAFLPENSFAASTALTVGADEVVPKPVDPQTLSEMVQQFAST